MASARSPAPLPSAFSYLDLATEAEREAFMRRRVYPPRVARGEMTPSDADRRIAMMEEIARRLRDAGGGMRG